MNHESRPQGRPHPFHDDSLFNENGERMEVKEGVVLDRDDNPIPIYSEQRQRGFEPRIHVWRLGGIFAPIFLAAFVILLTVTGFTIIGGVIAFMLTIWIVRMLVRLVLSLFGR